MNIENYQKSIAVCIKAGLVPMGHGPGGIGKTQSNKQVGDIIGDFFSLVGNHLTIDALTGIPFNKDGDLIWSRPEWSRLEGQGLLLVDEITDAMPSVQKMLYSLILEREVNGHRLGDGWAVSCAGNRPGDGSGSSMLPAPLITRLVHIGVCCQVPDFTRQLPESAEVDHVGWCRWAVKNGIVPEITAFIRSFPDMLYSFQATPRTWEMVSDLLKVITAADPITQELICGTVGPGVGVTFYGFLKLAATIPAPESILLDPAGAPIPSDLSVLHTLLSTLVYIAERKHVAALVEYAGRLSAEMGAYLLFSLGDKDAEFHTVPEYIRWYNANKDILT